MLRYETAGFFKLAEVDEYQNGCDPDTAETFSGDLSFSGATVEDVVAEIRRFFGVEESALLRDSCDEVGRLDLQRMETDDGDEPSPAQVADWKGGHYRLWLATYTFHIEAVTREPATLTLAPAAEVD